MPSISRFAAPLRAGAALLAVAAAGAAYANHGPGASGGGSSTISGETLKANKWEVTLREDFTSFDEYQPAQATRHALAHEDFDALHRSYATTLDLCYGVTDDFQVGLAFGYFVGEQFVSAEQTGPATAEVDEGNVNGLTDLTLMLKYRVYKGYWGNIAVLGGVKAPVGRDDVTLHGGEQPHPSDQPSTGAWDFPLGVAYSRFLTSHISMDASAMYTLRTHRDDFRMGDRLDAGISFSYRINDDITQFPQYSVFVESLVTYLKKDSHEGLLEESSGGVKIYITPGVRIRFNENLSFTLAPSFPVYQNSYGDQGDVDFKITMAFTYSQ